MPAKTKNKTKSQLKKKIQSAKYLPEDEKSEWLKIADSLNQEQINEVFEEISKSNKEEYEFALKVLVKNDKGKEILSMSKEITDKFKKQALAKQESHIKGKEEKPEEILQKLNQL